MKKTSTLIFCLIGVISFTTQTFGQTYFRSICQGDTVMYWGNTYAQTGTYNNGSALLYLQVDSLPPTNLVVEDIILCSAQDSLYATCDYNSVANRYWYVSRLPNGAIYQVPLGNGFHPNSPGTYLAVVTNGCGSDSTTVVVNNCPSISDTICLGDSVFFNNQWLTQSGYYVNTDSTLWLEVKVTPQININSYDTVCNRSLSVYGSYNIVWKLNGNIINGGNVVQPTTAGIYTAIASNYCGSDTASYVVNRVCRYNDTTRYICLGDSLFFNNRWLTQQGRYYDTIHLGAIDSIIVLDLVPITSSPQAAHIYTLDSLCNYGLRVEVDNYSSGNNYGWKLNGNTVGTTTMTFYPRTTGTYTAIVSNVCGSDTASYTVNNVCRERLISDTICAGDSLFFNNQWLTQAGTYLDTIENGTTDTIIKLNLRMYNTQLFVYSHVDTFCNTRLYAAIYNDNTYNINLNTIVWTYNGDVIGYGASLNVIMAGTYTAIAYGHCESDTVSIVVAPCSHDISDVWPGDADNNNIADNYDLLSIGIGYGIHGSARANPSLAWEAQSCINWGVMLLNGTNIKHVDCDGNGIINADDTLAIMQNFGLIHGKTEDERASRSDIPSIYVVFEKDRFQNGDTLIASIQLGDASFPLLNIYGLAYTYHFDQSIIDTSTIQFIYPNSWLGDSSDKISISKEFKDVGKIKTAVTRIKRMNGGRFGYGEIAQFRAIVSVNDSGSVSIGTNNFISGVKAVNHRGDSIPLNEKTIFLSVTNIGQVQTNILWSLYPNPTNSSITIKSAENIEGIEIYNVLGEKVYRETTQRKQTKVIDVSNLPNGVYIAQIKGSKGSGEKRFIVAR